MKKDATMKFLNEIYLGFCITVYGFALWLSVSFGMSKHNSVSGYCRNTLVSLRIM